MGVTNWKRKSQDREQSSAILEEAGIHRGLWCQKKKKKKKKKKNAKDKKNEEGD